MENRFKLMESPVGVLMLVARGDSLVAVLWQCQRENRVKLRDLKKDPCHPVLLETERQLNEYFAGSRRKFALTLHFTGTAFQKKVWRALLAIPFGETRTYGQIAQQLASPKAVRAVGGASGRNPVSIIVPCHRVVGASGKLTGFAGGLGTKAYLLHLEGHKNIGDS